MNEPLITAIAIFYLLSIPYCIVLLVGYIAGMDTVRVFLFNYCIRLDRWAYTGFIIAFDIRLC